jgi:hypothetical protein
VVFRRLAVFAGGFSLPLAQAVAADERIDAWAVLDLLGHLVDKSLVTIDTQDNVAGPRYRLLETARAFAFEQLGAAGETQAWLCRHAQALYDLLLPLHTTRWTLDDAMRTRADAEIDNLRAALDWAAGPGGDPLLGHKLHGVAHVIWHHVGQHIEGQERFRHLPTLALSPEIEARAHLALARLGYLGGQEECYRAAERAAALFDALGDETERCDALCLLVYIGVRRDEHATVEAALREIDRMVKPAWPAGLRAGVALAHATACLAREDAAGAVEAAWRQHACYVELGSRIGQLIAEGNVALYECQMGDCDVAIGRLERLAVEFRELAGPARVLATLRGHWSLACVLRNGPGDLVRGIEAAREVWPRLRRQQSNSMFLSALALAQARRGALEHAVSLLGYVETKFAAEGIREKGWIRRVQDEVRALCERAGAAQFNAWYEAGKKLDEDAATKLAFALD